MGEINGPVVLKDVRYDETNKQKKPIVALNITQ